MDCGTEFHFISLVAFTISNLRGNVFCFGRVYSCTLKISFSVAVQEMTLYLGCPKYGQQYNRLISCAKELWALSLDYVSITEYQSHYLVSYDR